MGDDPDKVQLETRLREAIDNSPAIGQLAENPLLLTMMAILNRKQKLPKKRYELYNKASEVLLHQWELEKNLPIHPDTIGLKEKQAICRKVAYGMQSAPQGLAGNLIEASRLENILVDYLGSLRGIENTRKVAQLIIKQLRERNFILCFSGADYYAFVHRTFLEYFCAWEYVWQFEKERKIDIEYLRLEVFGNHWKEESWHEVLRLIVGMIDDSIASEILKYFVSQSSYSHKRLFLAASCLLEVKNRFLIVQTSNKLLNGLKGIVKTYKTSNVRQEAVREITQGWANDSDAFDVLKSVAQSDQNYYVRQEAIKAIAQGWGNNAKALNILKSVALSSQDKDLQLEIIKAIAQEWTDNPDALDILKSLAQSTENEDVQLEVIKAIAQGWGNNADALDILKFVALSYQDRDVRQEAVRAIAQEWTDNPDALDILKSMAQSAPTKYIRKEAIRMIAQGWANHPNTLPLLQEIVKNERSMKVREFAKNALETINQNQS